MRQWFEDLRDLVEVVAEGHATSLMVRGTGGVGKTYEVTAALQKGHHSYEHLRGYTTPLGLYNKLYEHRQGLVVIDDCDSIFKDTVGLEILKSVLDTYEERPVCWNSTGARARTTRFVFEGRVIFITNLSLERLNQHMQALVTRVMVFCVDLSMDEVIRRIRQISRKQYKGSTAEQRSRVVSYLRAKRFEIPDLNLRHYIHALDLLLSGRRNWRRLFMEIT